MDVLRQDIEDKVAVAGYDSNCILTFENIVNTASKLKPGKHDGHVYLVSTQTMLLMHATSYIFILLCFCQL